MPEKNEAKKILSLVIDPFFDSISKNANNLNNTNTIVKGCSIVLSDIIAHILKPENCQEEILQKIFAKLLLILNVNFLLINRN